MKTIQLGLLLLTAVFCLSACNKSDKKEGAKSVTRLASVKGYDTNSTLLDSSVIYDEQGRISQIDFMEKITYEESKVKAVYRSGNAQNLLRSELTLKDGKPVSIYTEYSNPADSTSNEVFLFTKGTFSQNGDTLSVKELSYTSSSEQMPRSLTTHWITDDTGHMKKIINIITDGENIRNSEAVCYYDEAHACPDIATAYFVSLLGAADLMLLISGNHPGITKSMPLRFEMKNSPWSVLSFVNEYNDEGLCVRSLMKADNETKADIQFKYETVL